MREASFISSPEEIDARYGILPLGRQTGNANVTPDHPVKEAIKAQLNGGKRAFLSIHGHDAVKMGVYLGFLLNSEAGRILANYGS